MRGVLSPTGRAQLTCRSRDLMNCTPIAFVEHLSPILLTQPNEAEHPSSLGEQRLQQEAS